MRGRELIVHIEDAFTRLGYEISYEKLGEGRGGSYRLGDEKKVIIDSAIPHDERVSVLIETLKEIDTSEVFLSPIIRKLIGKPAQDEDW